uniref:type VI secretion system baseplate subunit TssE n=1 Tax=Puniceibacterium confluentis TaxID=1958944 RepID=UPI00356A3FE9
VLREAVRRDIEMLFNIERLEANFLLTDREALDNPSPASLLEAFPEVRSSVVNYGVPSFSGRSGSDFNKDDLAREIKAVLNIYEPRLKRDSVRVRVRTGEKTGMRIDIDGVLLLSPVPERLRLSTSIDMDNGRALTALEER